MKRISMATVVMLSLGLMCSASAMAQTTVTVGASGIYPAGTTFNGVQLNGLQSGYGVEISGSSALGQFCTVLLGVTTLGLPQNIVLEGKATSGSRNANIATFSGTCSLNMGDGTPTTPGVPFTATITTGANGLGSIGLVIGISTLPAAAVDYGSMTIQ